MATAPIRKQSTRERACKECKRLKLKCDKHFPCSNCTKRGCSSICPDGELVTGRGSRFILSGSEQLYEKNCQLIERIRALEDALREETEGRGRGRHGLMSEEGLKIKCCVDLIVGGRPDGQQQPQPPSSTMNPRLNQEKLLQQQRQVLPLELTLLATTLPFVRPASTVPSKDVSQHLPPPHLINHLHRVYHTNVSWLFLHPIPSSAMMNGNSSFVAEEFALLALAGLLDLSSPSSPSSSSTPPPPPPPSSSSPEKEPHHHSTLASLSRSALVQSLSSNKTSTHVLETIRTLVLIASYSILGDQGTGEMGVVTTPMDGLEAAWRVVQSAISLGYSHGLHELTDYTPSSPPPPLLPSSIDPEEAKEVWEELVVLECILALEMSRIPTCSLYTPSSASSRPGSSSPSSYKDRIGSLGSPYTSYLSSLSSQILLPLLSSSSSSPSSSRSGEEDYYYDRSLTEHHVPPSLRLSSLSPPSSSSGMVGGGGGMMGLGTVLQRGRVAGVRALACLHIHLPTLLSPLSSPPSPQSLEEPLKSSQSLITLLRYLASENYQLTKKMGWVWRWAFKGAVVLAFIATRFGNGGDGGGSGVGMTCCRELDLCIELFEGGGGNAGGGRYLPTLRMIRSKAYGAVYPSSLSLPPPHMGGAPPPPSSSSTLLPPPSLPPHHSSYTPPPPPPSHRYYSHDRSHSDEEDMDMDLDRLNGRTTLVRLTAANTSASRRSLSSHSGSRSRSRSPERERERERYPVLPPPRSLMMGGGPPFSSSTTSSGSPKNNNNTSGGRTSTPRGGSGSPRLHHSHPHAHHHHHGGHACNHGGCLLHLSHPPQHHRGSPQMHHSLPPPPPPPAGSSSSPALSAATTVTTLVDERRSSNSAPHDPTIPGTTLWPPYISSRLVGSNGDGGGGERRRERIWRLIGRELGIGDGWVVV